MSAHKGNSKHGELGQRCRVSALLRNSTWHKQASVLILLRYSKAVVLYPDGELQQAFDQIMSACEMILQSFLPLDNAGAAADQRASQARPRSEHSRQASHGQRYLHVSSQDLYHAGPENTQLIASVQYGKQISQCQDVSRSGRQEGERGGRENKTKQRSYFPGLSRKSSSCTTLTSGLHITQALQLTRSSDA